MTQTPAKNTAQNSNTNNSALKLPSIPGNGYAAPEFPSSSQPPRTQMATDRARSESLQRRTDRLSKPEQPSIPRFWQRLKIRSKATALAIVIGTVPVLAIGAAADYFASQSITRKIEQTKQNIVSQLANEINVFMTDRFADIQVLGQLPIFTDTTVSEATSLEKKVALLDRYVNLYGVYNSVALFNLEGDTVVQAQGKPVPNHLTRDYFQRIMQTGEPTINPPSISRTTGTLSMHLASPVKDTKTDQITGIIRFQLPVQGLEKIADEYGTEGDKYYLVDSNGKYFLASGNEERIGQPAAEHFPQYDNLQAAQKLASVIDVDPDDGSKQLLTYVPLQDMAGLPELDFGVLIASDTQKAFESRQQLFRTISLGTAVAAMLIATIAVLIANRVTRPIVAAADAVEKIGEGDLDTRLFVQGTDEMAALGTNINKMADQLGTLLQEQAIAAEKARLLADVTGARTLSLEDLEPIFNQVVEKAQAIIDADRVVIYRFNPDWSGYITAESVKPGWHRGLNESISDPCIPSKLIDAYRNGRVMTSRDVFAAGFHPDHLQLMERLQVKANLVVPIVNQERLLGLLVAHQCSSVYDWKSTEIDFFKQLATQLGLVVDRITLLEQTEKQAAEQRQLKEGLQKRALELLREVDPISQGDLTIRAQVTADEIGTVADSYNATVASLRKIVAQVQAAASQVGATTGDNETAVQELSAEAARQAMEISAALDQVQSMAESIQAVAANAKQAETAMQQASQTVIEGDAAMNRTVDGIQSIRATVAETAKKVKHLGESSQKISTVVELISSFASQTNMLALNASIEASRAGEEGRGFAVVADEVRALARRSAEATSEIKKFVADIQSETNEVVMAMESGTEQVVAGTKLVDATRQNLNKITAMSAEVSQLVEAITQATVEQSQTSETVTQTMTNVAAIAEKTSTEATQVSSSFKQLRTVAQELEKEVGQFKVS
ncbi:MAG: GAF domain-containing protein [Cyanothece sp. SIO1E1]|nr:GAF domain-containing protein [Cyanothece sp. SIO1E1]